MTARPRVVHWRCSCGARGDDLVATQTSTAATHRKKCRGRVGTLTRAELRDEIATQVGRWA